MVTTKAMIPSIPKTTNNNKCRNHLIDVISSLYALLYIAIGIRIVVRTPKAAPAMLNSVPKLGITIARISQKANPITAPILNFQIGRSWNNVIY